MSQELDSDEIKEIPKNFNQGFWGILNDKGPFVITFVITWAIWNWKLFIEMISSDKAKDKIEYGYWYLKDAFGFNFDTTSISTYRFANDNLVFYGPLFYAIIIYLGAPYLNRGAILLNNELHAGRKDHLNSILNKTKKDYTDQKTNTTLKEELEECKEELDKLKVENEGLKRELNFNKVRLVCLKDSFNSNLDINYSWNREWEEVTNRSNQNLSDTDSELYESMLRRFTYISSHDN